MQKPIYHNGRALAISAGIAATGGALAILLADPITTGNWRLDHGLLPVIVGVTIAAGHLVGSALKSRKILSAFGFAAIFMLGTVLTVYSSVGSQRAATGDKVLSVEAHNKAFMEKQAELVTSRNRLSVAESMVDRETANKRCAQSCNDWKVRTTEVRSHIAIIEAQLARMGGEKIARPKAQAFAEMMAVFGFDRAKIEHAASVLESYAYSLLLELTAITAFGYGCAPRRLPMPIQPETSAMPVPRRTMTVPTLRIVHPTQKEAALKDLQGLLAAGQVIPSQDWLTARWNLQSKGTTSKWLADWETSGLVSRASIGRFKTVDRAA